VTVPPHPLPSGERLFLTFQTGQRTTRSTTQTPERGGFAPGPHRAAITEMRSSDPDPRAAYAARGRIFPAPARAGPAPRSQRPRSKAKSRSKAATGSYQGGVPPPLPVKRTADLGLSNKGRFDRPRHGKVKTDPRQPPPAPSPPSAASAPRPAARKARPHPPSQTATGKTPGQPARPQSAESGRSQDRPPGETDIKVCKGV
jgi:hypothetical protein